MNINQALKTLRHEKGLTQVQVAAALDITQGSYSTTFESANANPTLASLEKLAAVFGVSASVIVELAEYSKFDESEK